MIKNIQEYNLIKDEITCEICYGLVIKPKICESCETVFCENCINNWKNKNNSCPKRCSKFIIKDAPKIMKKLLDKLIIKCSFCQNEFNYQNYIYNHFPECYKKNRLVKCPFCSDCKIKYILIEDYENLLKEKKELLNELKLCKERLKEFEKNNNKILYKWSLNQKKNNFILSNDNKTIKIDYSSCYNAYFLDYNFVDELEYSIDISVNTFDKNLDYIYIGFMNENENIFSTGNCLCSKPDNSFYFRIDNKTIYQGKTEIKTQIKNKTKLNLKFILNLKKKTLDIKNYDSNKSYGIINIIGKCFKFFVGKCNPGIIEYTLLQ